MIEWFYAKKVRMPIVESFATTITSNGNVIMDLPKNIGMDGLVQIGLNCMWRLESVELRCLRRWSNQIEKKKNERISE